MNEIPQSRRIISSKLLGPTYEYTLKSLVDQDSILPENKQNFTLVKGRERWLKKEDIFFKLFKNFLSINVFCLIYAGDIALSDTEKRDWCGSLKVNIAWLMSIRIGEVMIELTDQFK